MMLIRIVKMTFQPERTKDFIKAFESRKDLIGNFEGCAGVELLRDIQQENVFLTYSKWQSEQALELYRQSELFQTTWDEVKKWFNGKPEAWSVQIVSFS
jgi:quinol monooxygenase YgiN